MDEIKERYESVFCERLEALLERIISRHELTAAYNKTDIADLRADIAALRTELEVLKGDIKVLDAKVDMLRQNIMFALNAIHRQ